jgi:SAM-dependent methyltransferase
MALRPRMSTRRTADDTYKMRYADLGFERSGLFELIREKYKPMEVLYPGCSVHITPAFCFPHVVFVDRDPNAMKVFADQEVVIEMVRRRRTYRRAPFIQFIGRDFTKPLPIRKGQFDLILALFTPGVSKACSPYLKPGGLLLSSIYRGDALDAARKNELALLGVIEIRLGKYRLVRAEPGVLPEAERRTSWPKRYLRQASGGVEYVEDEKYLCSRGCGFGGRNR